jgi:hypothetical protein
MPGVNESALSFSQTKKVSGQNKIIGIFIEVPDLYGSAVLRQLYFKPVPVKRGSQNQTMLEISIAV